MRASLRRKTWHLGRLLALALAAAEVLGEAAQPGTPPGAQPAPGDPWWERQGLLPVTQFGAVADDAGDDTEAIQAALVAARDRGLTTYLPAGTYLVSDTLKCYQRVADNGKRLILERRKPCSMVGASRGGRSGLRLAAGAQGFDDPGHPKPLLWFWAQPERGPHAGSDDPAHADPTVSFNQVVRAIDFDLRAAGNAGAVAVRHAGSQGSTIEDVTVLAQGAFAGLYDTPGQGGGVYDLRVIGGRYGVYATGDSRYPVLVGCRFSAQETEAVHWAGNVVLVMVGFSIEKTSPGPAIVLQPGGPIYGRGVALVDGRIEARGPLAIDNRAGKALTLTDVYVKTDGDVLKSAGKPPVAAAGPWTQVREYAYTGRGYVSMIEGETRPEGFEAVALAAGTPPSGEALVRSHLWDADFPSFDQAGVVDVRRYGALPDDTVDDTDAIQKALDSHSNVLLPKGVFLLSRPLRLGPSNELFGTGKTTSILQESRTWRGDAAAPLVTTVADRDARSSISFLLIETRSPGRTALEWRAGAASIVRDIMAGPVSGYYGKRVSSPGHSFRIAETGGGRWYATAAEWGDLHGSTYDPGYSHLLVEGTSQPLAFYGLNLERDAVWPQAIIRDSSNVDIFYLKTEADEWPKGARPPGVLLVERCVGLRLFGMAGNAHPPDSALVTLDASAGILLAQVAGFKPSTSFSNVVDSASGNSRKVSGETPLALFKRRAGSEPMPR